MHPRSLRTVIPVLVIAAMCVTSAPASAAPRCFGKEATIVATNRDPLKPVELHGTSGNDVIAGRGGWDIIDARGGRDLVCSGGADDYVTGGEGNDKVKLGDGIDTAHGGPGKDDLRGGSTLGDSLSGGPGPDRLHGGSGSDDSLIGGAGDDLLDGGRGYDLAEFWDSPNPIEADLEADLATGHGTDTLTSIEGLIGSHHDDLLLGDEYSNLLRGSEGSDEVHAFGSSLDGASDIIQSGIGNDVIDGGEGSDTLSYNLSPFAVEADLSTGTAMASGGFGSDQFTSIDQLIGSKYDDSLTGDAEANVIVGNRGDDVMDGRGGIDVAAFYDSAVPVVADLAAGTAVAEGWGSDTFTSFENLDGSASADTLTGDDGPNELWGGWGRDTLNGAGGDDVLLGDKGADEADGGDGTDSCEAETQFNCEQEAVAGAAGWSGRDPKHDPMFGYWDRSARRS